MYNFISVPNWKWKDICCWCHRKWYLQAKGISSRKFARNKQRVFDWKLNFEVQVETFG